ncbi:MAG: DUF2637 domain-containing protein [Nocardia sp.]|nr:DUF2637 domain-containing protein [Nocardia sp.]
MIDDTPAVSREAHSLRDKVAGYRPTPLQASVAVTVLVTWKSFQLSYAALVGLAVKNHVESDLASNVPLVLEGLTIGAVIATAQFRIKSLAWGYASALFLLMSLTSVAGNVEFAREIGGGLVACVIHGGMPLVLLFSVHLTLLLWEKARSEVVATDVELAHIDDTRTGAADLVSVGVEEAVRPKLGVASSV